MTIALDIVKGALRRIGAYQSGETIAPQDAQDSLDTFNDLLDSWSTAKQHIFGTVENIFDWVPNQKQYTVGNPSNEVLDLPDIVGTLATNVITTTSIPSELVAGTSIQTGSNLSDLQGVIPAGTYVTAIGATTITMSVPITGTPNGSDIIYWTVPGNIGIARPLRITSGFTRINELDFWFDVKASEIEYNAILYKFQPGPWPVLGWYNNTFPYGILNVYQMPGMTAEVHLFTDTILADLELSSVIAMPQGYVRALKWVLAKELWAEYWGSQPLPNSLKEQAADALNMIKALNSKPEKVSFYDRELVRGNRPDGGWITHGGFR